MVLLLALAAPATLAAAAGPAEGGRRGGPQGATIGRPAGRPRAPTTSYHHPDGTLVVRAPAWRATVGPDGNLHSFQVGETELLDDRVAISLGGFLYGDGPIRLGSPTEKTPSVWEATGQGCAIAYRFSRRETEITLRNTGSKALTYFVVLSADIVIAESIQTGEAAAAPATERWPDVRFLTSRGVYIELVGATRIWGPWLGRQVWEISRIAPGEAAVVRVRGGVTKPPQTTVEQLVGLAARILSPDALVPIDRPIEVQADVENRSDTGLSAEVSMELSGCRSDVLLTATSGLDLPAKQSTSTLFRAPVQAPDFYTSRVVLTVEGRGVRKSLAAAGYRVSEIRPVVTRPDDFREFWQGLLAEVGSEPPLSHLAPSAEYSRDGVTAWLLEYEGLGGKRIYGWYLRPEAGARHPAILYLPVYGARPVRPPVALAKGGYAVLAVDVRGNRVDAPRPRAFEDYCTQGIESPDSYVYREIVGQCVKAVQLLAAREDVDGERIAALGMSEGGGVALMLGALMPEVKAVAADAPLLCDLPLSIEAAGWPYTSISRYLHEHPDSGEAVRKTLSYFDVANFAPDVRCPVLVAVGFLDQVSLPAAVYGAFNLLPGPKEMKPLPNAGHEGGDVDLWSYKLSWLAKTLGAGGHETGEEGGAGLLPESP